MTPAKVVTALRVEAARRLLEETGTRLFDWVDHLSVDRTTMIGLLGFDPRGRSADHGPGSNHRVDPLE